MDAKGPETDFTIETDCHQVVTKWSPSGQQVAVKLWIFSSFSIPNAIPSKYMKTEHISFHFNKLKIPTYHNTTQRLQNVICFVLKALKMFSSKYRKDEIVRTSNFILGTFSPTTKQQSCRLWAHKKRVFLLQLELSMIFYMSHSQMLGKFEYGLPAKF